MDKGKITSDTIFTDVILNYDPLFSESVRSGCDDIWEGKVYIY